MAKKTGKLKQLFLFNGLLLAVAFILIQYSVVEHDDVQESDADAPVLVTTEVENNGHVEDVYKGIIGESAFSRQMTVFDTAVEPYNIPFKNILGKDMTLDDLKGQWVVLNFWASWCPPCIKEMPSLQSLQDQYGGKGVKVIAIGLDRDMDRDKLGRVLQKFGFGPVAAYFGDWPTIKPHFEITALPTTFILSPSGQMVAMVKGHIDWVGADALAYIDGLLN